MAARRRARPTNQETRHSRRTSRPAIRAAPHSREVSRRDWRHAVAARTPRIARAVTWAQCDGVAARAADELVEAAL